MMQNGDRRRAAWLVLCACLCCACQVYDASLAPSVSDASNPGDAATSGTDAATKRDADICIPGPEICNKLDDDCDGQVDETTAAQADCESRIAHAMTTCQSGYCLRLACLAGYYNCDGHPENGCESTCPCGMNCGDAGGIDAGNDDAGRTPR